MSVSGSGIGFTILTLPILLGWTVGWFIGKRPGPRHVRWGQLFVVVVGLSFLHAVVAAFVVNGGKFRSYHMLHAFGPDGPRDEIYAQWIMSFVLVALVAAMTFAWFRWRGRAKLGGSKT